MIYKYYCYRFSLLTNKNTFDQNEKFTILDNLVFVYQLLYYRYYTS